MDGTINIYKHDGVWFYALFNDDNSFDHTDNLDVEEEASEADAVKAAEALFAVFAGTFTINRVDDECGGAKT
jgi:hypothetical protein